MNDNEYKWANVRVYIGGKELVGVINMRYKPRQRTGAIVVDDVSTSPLPNTARITELSGYFEAPAATITLSVKQMYRLNKLLKKVYKRRLPRKLKKQKKKVYL